MVTVLVTTKKHATLSVMYVGDRDINICTMHAARMMRNEILDNPKELERLRKSDPYRAEFKETIAEMLDAIDKGAHLTEQLPNKLKDVLVDDRITSNFSNRSARTATLGAAAQTNAQQDLHNLPGLVATESPLPTSSISNPLADKHLTLRGICDSLVCLVFTEEDSGIVRGLVSDDEFSHKVNSILPPVYSGHDKNYLVARDMYLVVKQDMVKYKFYTLSYARGLLGYTDSMQVSSISQTDAERAKIGAMLRTLNAKHPQHELPYNELLHVDTPNHPH